MLGIRRTKNKRRGIDDGDNQKYDVRATMQADFTVAILLGACRRGILSKKETAICFFEGTSRTISSMLAVRMGKVL